MTEIRTRVALPEDRYLKRIGEIAYATSYIEWTLLGDLGRLRNQLPSSLTLQKLEGFTTSGIARSVKEAVDGVESGSIKEYLVACYQGLYRLAAIRNDVLHARPATSPTQGQRLLRVGVKNQEATGERFWIDDDWLDKAMSEINDIVSSIGVVRPPLP